MSSSIRSSESSSSRSNLCKSSMSRIPKFGPKKSNHTNTIQSSPSQFANVSVQRSVSNMESKSGGAAGSMPPRDDETECFRLKGLIAVEQHRFICERIELQNAHTQLAVLSSEFETIEFEQLKEELQTFRDEAQEQFDAYEKRNTEQCYEITELHRQLNENQKTIEENNHSLAILSQLLVIRTDLIAAMQSKEEQMATQLSYANQVATEKSDDWQKMLASMLTNDEKVQQLTEQMDGLRSELDASQMALATSEARCVKLIEVNGQLKLQFHKIMSYRDLKV